MAQSMSACNSAGSVGATSITDTTDLSGIPAWPDGSSESTRWMNPVNTRLRKGTRTRWPGKNVCCLSSGGKQ